MLHRRLITLSLTLCLVLLDSCLKAQSVTKTMANDSLVDADGAKSCRGPANETPLAAQTRLTGMLLNDALRYARENADPKTGFVRDTVPNFGSAQNTSLERRASISSTGFMMALVADLYVKGKVSKDEAYQYCRRPIDAVVQRKTEDLQRAVVRQQSGASDPHIDLSYRGWFSHFIDSASGERWPKSEYAVTDTTWFVAGAMGCAAAFPDSDLPKLVNEKIYGDVDFVAMMTNGGTKPKKRTLALSYKPEEGYKGHDWVIFQHSWLAYLLGLGTPNPAHRLSKESWSAWDRTGATLEGVAPELDGKVLYGNRRALFSHYFPAVFLNPRLINESCGIDYFDNSVTATLYNRAVAADDRRAQTFAAGYWGLDAGPNPSPVLPVVAPGTSPTVGSPESVVYGVNTPVSHNTNACLACAVASAEFVPKLVFQSLHDWCEEPLAGAKIWGRYGPANGLDLDHGWIAPWALSGIVGPMALSIANLDEKTSVWSLFAASPAVKMALAQIQAAPPPVHGCLLPEGKH